MIIPLIIDLTLLAIMPIIDFSFSNIFNFARGCYWIYFLLFILLNIMGFIISIIIHFSLVCPNSFSIGIIVCFYFLRVLVNVLVPFLNKNISILKVKFT